MKQSNTIPLSCYLSIHLLLLGLSFLKDGINMSFNFSRAVMMPVKLPISTHFLGRKVTRGGFLEDGNYLLDIMSY